MSTQPGESVEGITVPKGNPDALLGRRAQARGRRRRARAPGAADRQDADADERLGRPRQLHLRRPHRQPGRRDAERELVGPQRRPADLDVRRRPQGRAGAGAEGDRAREAGARGHQRRQGGDPAGARRREGRAGPDGRGRDRPPDARRCGCSARRSTPLLGDGGAQAAIDAANAAYSAAETDLHEAERREKRARTKLKHAEDDMRDARKDGQDAADDAQTTGLLLQGVLRTMPAGVLGSPGLPSEAQLGEAGNVPKPQPQNIPISEMQPPKDWPRVEEGAVQDRPRRGHGARRHRQPRQEGLRRPGEDPRRARRARLADATTTRSAPGRRWSATTISRTGGRSTGSARMGLAAPARRRRHRPVARVTLTPRDRQSRTIEPLGRIAPDQRRQVRGRRLDFTSPTSAHGRAPASRRSRVPARRAGRRSIRTACGSPARAIPCSRPTRSSACTSTA